MVCTAPLVLSSNASIPGLSTSRLDDSSPPNHARPLCSSPHGRKSFGDTTQSGLERRVPMISMPRCFPTSSCWLSNTTPQRLAPTLFHEQGEGADDATGVSASRKGACDGTMDDAPWRHDESQSFPSLLEKRQARRHANITLSTFSSDGTASLISTSGIRILFTPT